MTGAGPWGCPMRGGQGEGGSTSLRLSSHPFLHCYLMGQEGGVGGQETTGAATGLTSCLTPEKGKVSQLPPELEWGLGRMAASSVWVGGFLPPSPLPHTHLSLTQHSVRG